jgi:uncharacterized 2Fe-2S/4Fe-4S cluster protein (DUF4445 family)
VEVKEALWIEILPDKIRHQFPSPIALKTVFEEIDLPVLYPCGGNHTCGKCAVQFKGSCPDPSYHDQLFFTPQELQEGWRLSCVTVVSSPSTVYIPAENRLYYNREVKTSLQELIPVQPVLKKYFLKLSPATLENLKGDIQLVQENIYQEHQIRTTLPLSVLKRLPAVLRENRYQLTVTVLNQQIIDIEGGDKVEHAYGLAVDLGTTSLVASLHHLPSGETLGIASSINPQVRFGADLISRLTYLSREKNGLLHLQQVIIQAINSLIEELCGSYDISLRNLYILTVSGNSGMNHLLLGIDPQSLALAPYTPVFKELREEKGRDLGLEVNEQAIVMVLPNLGGFVGGDVLADMLVAGFGQGDRTIKLLIDIGTNCEVVVETGAVRLTASAPAGPALEGSCISFGMRAEPGAIYDAHWQGNELLVDTIDNEPARGICGSGLFHLIDALMQKKIIQSNGKWATVDDLNNETVTGFYRQKMGTHNGEVAVLLCGVLTGAKRNVYLTQGDIRAFQLAKSAITSAWQVLCGLARIQPSAIDEVYIAGAFGNFIRSRAAINLNVVPRIDINRIHFIGDASLEGSRRVLLNDQELNRIEKLAATTQFIELAGRTDFQELYVHNLLLDQ